MIISSQDNAEAWSQGQWVANARSAVWAQSSAGKPRAPLLASQLLFSNNQIDHFGDDGIDYAASNLAITHNDLHDNLNIGDGNHEDAMQGQNGPLAAGVAFNAFSNILIDSNLISAPIHMPGNST